jgi:hypothetical protein
MEHLLPVAMYAVCMLQITVLLVSLDLFNGTFHQLFKLLISAQFHPFLCLQGRVEFSLFMPQMRMMNVRYNSSHLWPKH